MTNITPTQQAPITVSSSLSLQPLQKEQQYQPQLSDSDRLVYGKAYDDTDNNNNNNNNNSSSSKETDDIDNDEDDDYPLITRQMAEIWRTVQLRAVWRPMAFVYCFNLMQVC